MKRAVVEAADDGRTGSPKRAKVGAAASSSQREEEEDATSSINRRGGGGLAVRHRQRGALELAEQPQDAAQVDGELCRSICIALHGCGFDAVTGRALESFRAAAEEYLLRFAHKVQRSMQGCRRTQPLPQDFIHALAQSSLSPSALLAERDLTVPARATQAPVVPQDPTKYSRQWLDQPFLPPDAREPDRRRRTYVPRHFPALPGEHAWQDTPSWAAARETDTLRIRERAMAEGEQVERALRKLMAASGRRGAGAAAGARRRLAPGSDAKARAMFEAALSDLVAEDADARARNPDVQASFGSSNEIEDEGAITAVDYDRRYWRRGGGVIAA